MKYALIDIYGTQLAQLFESETKAEFARSELIATSHWELNELPIFKIGVINSTGKAGTPTSSSKAIT